VRQGECLSSIAELYGFSDWRVIYNDAQNADFRKKRPNPNLIYPGDELYIPDLREKDVDCPTDKRTKFVLHRQPTYLNVRLQDVTKQPITNARYQLILSDLKLEGTTDGDGWIKAKIPARAEDGLLKLWPCPSDPDTMIEWPLKLGHLDPLETTSGVKARLNNLGYDCGEVNEDQDESYDAAVRQFQEDNGLVVDGIVGPQTRGKLQQDHRV
jgi:hypothetical protein